MLRRKNKLYAITIELTNIIVIYLNLSSDKYLCYSSYTAMFCIYRFIVIFCVLIFFIFFFLSKYSQIYFITETKGHIFRRYLDEQN